MYFWCDHNLVLNCLSEEVAHVWLVHVEWVNVIIKDCYTQLQLLLWHYRDVTYPPYERIAYASVCLVCLLSDCLVGWLVGWLVGLPRNPFRHHRHHSVMFTTESTWLLRTSPTGNQRYIHDEVKKNKLELFSRRILMSFNLLLFLYLLSPIMIAPHVRFLCSRWVLDHILSKLCVYWAWNFERLLRSYSGVIVFILSISTWKLHLKKPARSVCTFFAHLQWSRRISSYLARYYPLWIFINQMKYNIPCAESFIDSFYRGLQFITVTLCSTLNAQPVFAEPKCKWNELFLFLYY
jgi:hypothetical protein